MKSPNLFNKRTGGLIATLVKFGRDCMITLVNWDSLPKSTEMSISRKIMIKCKAKIRDIRNLKFKEVG